MRKTLLPLALGCLSLSFAFFPAFKAGSKNAIISTSSYKAIKVSESANNAKADEASTLLTASANLYDSLNLGKLGLSFDALQYAYKGYQRLLTKHALGDNSDILTVIDFSQSSHKKRMYILDMKNMKVLVNTYAAHGKNSGLNYAEAFSNIPESLQSSLGFYVTKNTYTGKHGLSLRLDGKDRGFNDKAEERAVVVHGADYIGDQRLGSAYMGRSFGCPAVPQAISAKVINYIKNGSCLFIYHPSKNYLHGSTILNG
ncbi:MAG TPA: murein L,D-transpeptidase catalytic domain family protein [Chitinophagaceae bacterium]|nr:murein L,D-transpeptidase catalytic domain family protein [Chitinophagaceae bacterium]